MQYSFFRKRIIISAAVIALGMLMVCLISGTLSSRQYTTTNETTALARENQYADVPVYPQSVPVNASIEAPGQIGYTANWTSTHSVREITLWFPAELIRLGWSVDVPPEGTVEQISYIGARKPDKYLQVSIMYVQESGSTVIHCRILKPMSDTEEHEEI